MKYLISKLFIEKTSRKLKVLTKTGFIKATEGKMFLWSNLVRQLLMPKIIRWLILSLRYIRSFDLNAQSVELLDLTGRNL
jgi:hypothetical protein